jgi:hypothetical protein
VDYYISVVLYLSNKILLLVRRHLSYRYDSPNTYTKITISATYTLPTESTSIPSSSENRPFYKLINTRKLLLTRFIKDYIQQ